MPLLVSEALVYLWLQSLASAISKIFNSTENLIRGSLQEDFSRLNFTIQARYFFLH
jgi:hypothetical protein